MVVGDAQRPEVIGLAGHLASRHALVVKAAAIGLTAGTRAPKRIVEEAVERLESVA